MTAAGRVLAKLDWRFNEPKKGTGGGTSLTGQRQSYAAPLSARSRITAVNASARTLA